MWTCPACGHKFFNKNQSHSCGHFTLDDFLENKTPEAIALFRHFIAEYRKIGRFELHPVKTRVALLTSMRFCSINKMGRDYVDIHLVLTETHEESSCFRRVENLGDRFFVHHLRLSHKEDVNAELRRYMEMAYAIGNREHVRKK